jgi:hypothetical protein
VVVHLDPCTRVDPEQFRRLLDIELNPLLDSSAERISSHTTTTVWLKCVPAGIQLYLEDSATGKSMARVVDLAHVVDHARGRLLVLLVTEFAVASWLELRLLRPRSADTDATPAPHDAKHSDSQLAEQHGVPVPAAAGALAASTQAVRTQPSQPVTTEEKTTNEAPDEPTDAAASDDVPSDADSAADGGHSHPWRLGLGFDVSGIQSVPSPLLGGEVSGAFRPWRALELCLGAQLSGTSFDGSLSGEPTPQIGLTLISASLLALFVQSINDFELSAGAGLRSGVALLQVVATDTITPQQPGAQFWLAPIAMLSAGYQVIADLRLRLNLELGVMARGVNVVVIENPGTPVAQQESVAALRGWFGAVTIGLDWTF